MQRAGLSKESGPVDPVYVRTIVPDDPVAKNSTLSKVGLCPLRGIVCSKSEAAVNKRSGF